MVKLKPRGNTKKKPLLEGVSTPFSAFIIDQSKALHTSLEFENMSQHGSDADGMISQPSQSMLGDSDEEDDFEAGNNQIKKKDDIDIEDEEKFEHNMMNEDDPEAITNRDTMTLAQKTNYFVGIYRLNLVDHQLRANVRL